MSAVPPYEVHFGFTRNDLILVPASVLFVAVGAFLLAESPFVASAGIALGGLYLVLRLATVASRRVALRVDHTGVTLGAMFPWSASRSATVPWPDIEAVVLWRQASGATKVNYIGLSRRRGASPLPGSTRPTSLRRLDHSSVRHVPPDVVDDSRPMAMFQVDRNRLAAALRGFRPEVQLIDLTG
jgi:hypothetical protein